MKHFILTAMAALATISACSGNAIIPEGAVTFDAPKGGQVAINMISHGSISIAYKDQMIQIDPVGNYTGKKIDYSIFPPADIILITHEHGDHLDPAIIEEISKEETVVVCNGASAAKLPGALVWANGDSQMFGKTKITAVPAYNITEGHTNFHPKGNGNGYLLEIGGLNIYVGGDTEDIPELADLKDIDIAFLPVNQPYTMTVDQCIKAAKVIQPKILVPYHLGQTNLQAIADGLEGSGIDVRLYESLR